MSQEYINGRELATICGRTWAEVDLDQAKRNFLWVQKQLAPDAAIVAVVKAGAYGHGAADLAQTYLEAGAAMLAVSCLDEVLNLRQAGITAPIHMLSEGEEERHAEGIEARATYTIYRTAQAQDLSRIALEMGTRATCHIKIDTGMGRIGFPAQDPETLGRIIEICQLPGLNVEGIFMHFATADGFDEADPVVGEEHGEAFVLKQFVEFRTLLADLEARGYTFRYRHCCNTAATLKHKEMHMDLVRVGLGLYGLLPDNYMKTHTGHSEILSLHSRVLQVKVLEPGQSVSYGRRFVAPRRMTVATVPVGYADGYRRSMLGSAFALIHGKRVPLIGTICMDACLFDVSSIVDPEGAVDGSAGGVKSGDPVVLWGTQGSETITMDEVASWQDTINYEVPCQLSIRIPRVYLKNGQPWKITHQLY